MIAVLDTHVLASGIFFAGAPLEILERWERGEFAIAVSPAILDEYQRVIQRLQSEYDLDAGAPILDIIRAKAITVADAGLPAQVCEDASDDKAHRAGAAAGRAGGLRATAYGSCPLPAHC